MVQISSVGKCKNKLSLSGIFAVISHSCPTLILCFLFLQLILYTHTTAQKCFSRSVRNDLGAELAIKHNLTCSDARTHTHTHTSELSYDLIHCLMHYAHDVHTGECTHWYKHRHSHSAFSFFLAWRFTHLSITGPHEIIIAASHTRSPIPSCRDLSI